jgi:hypothetical protein
MNRRKTKKLAQKYGSTPEGHDANMVMRRCYDRATCKRIREVGMTPKRVYGWPVTVIAAAEGWR